MFQHLFSKKVRPKPSVPPGTRIYAVGDVHGRIDLFEQILKTIRDDQISREPIDIEIIFLGDLIDRGPSSVDVVRHAMSSPAWADLNFIMGNHEAAMLAALDGDEEMLEIWLRVGGAEALVSWGLSSDFLQESSPGEIICAANATIPVAEIEWIRAMVPSIHVGDYFFTHAGVRPGIELSAQSLNDLLWIREDFLESSKDHGAIIVHGHSITEDIEIKENRVGLDTGAYKTHRLSAIGLENDERWFLST